MNAQSGLTASLRAAAAALLSGAVLAGCGGPGEQAAKPQAAQVAEPQSATPVPAASEPAGPLAGTEWRLVEIQSMDDAVGTVRPADPSLYTLRLNADGTAALSLNCNRATGTWTAEAGPDPSSGRFTFGPLAATSALCPPPSLDEQITAQAGFVRSYLLKDGRLYLSLMADGGIIAWEPQTDVPFLTEPDKSLEAAILDASPSYTKAMVDIGGGTGPARYVHGRADLNGDGRDEVFAYLLGPFFCGTGGCNLLLFTPNEVGYALINEFPISRLPVIVSAEKTAGWNDLYRLESGGGASATYVRHAFDGKKYVKKGRVAAVKAPAGTRCLVGELTFEKGIPLEPRK
jgi:heat shock protein HslJ